MGSTLQSRDQAEVIALQSLKYIAARPDLLMAFLRTSGISLIQLKQSAGNRQTLAGVLHFLLERESILLDFCREHDIAPTLPSRALHLIEGDQ
jgi:hypothetical protein